MKDVLLSLREENIRLSHLAETDRLTGLYNRMAMEKKVNEFLKARHFGILFVIDVDNFKLINDRYGHIAGDGILQGIAAILAKMTLPNDILGRIGGDEFVIFMPIIQGQDFIQSRCCQIQQRFLELPHSQFIVTSLSLTVCGSCYQPGDNYKSLFDRADQSLLEEKNRRKKRKSTANDRTDYSNDGKSLKMDLEQISRELSEPGKAEGAFCQDYESFKNIYRFMERRLRRVQTSVYSILITLTDEQGDFPVLQERYPIMETLHEIIQHSLRSGDVFTRYSSCQFLIMVSDANASEADFIAERIQKNFYQHTPKHRFYKLFYNRYPLKPAFSSGKELHKKTEDT